MYLKLLAWFKKETDKSYVLYALGIISFLESIILPIPVDIFTITLATMHPKRWVSYGTVATIFSVLGAAVGYYLGFHLFDSFGMDLINFYSLHDEFLRVTELFTHNTFLVIFTSAFTPIPYKVFTLASGALHINFFTFIIASMLGRGLRFFAETWIPFYFGPRMAERSEKILHRISWLLAILVIVYLVLWWFKVV